MCTETNTSERFHGTNFGYFTLSSSDNVMATPTKASEGLSAPDINIIPSTPLATSPNVVTQQEEEEEEQKKEEQKKEEAAEVKEKEAEDKKVCENLRIFLPQWQF